MEFTVFLNLSNLMRGLKNILTNPGYPSPADLSMERTSELSQHPFPNRCSEVLEQLRCMISIKL